MSVIREQKNSKIRDFEFDSFDNAGIIKCKTDHQVKDNPLIKKYDEKEFLNCKENEKDQLSSIIKKERIDAKKNQFNILPIVEYYRGIKEQEQIEYDNKVKQVVAEKIYKYKDKAYQDAWVKGHEDGMKSMQSKLQEELKLKVDDLAKYIENIKSEHGQLLATQKQKIYKLVKTLTKWVILRELKDDGKYLERLLEKLILELNSSSNLLLKIGQENFEKISGVLEVFESKFEGIKNTRLEIIQDENELSKNGIILESDNEILDASFKTQFKNLDRIFEQLDGIGQDSFDQE